jgi:hypothetical protein
LFDPVVVLVSPAFLLASFSTLQQASCQKSHEAIICATGIRLPARNCPKSEQMCVLYRDSLTDMNFTFFIDKAAYWTLRVAGYALLNLGEDAALVALMFC